MQLRRFQQTDFRQAIVDRVCGVGSWVKMKARVAAHAVATKTEVGQLKLAIDTDDFDRVVAMMTATLIFIAPRSVMAGTVP